MKREGARRAKHPDIAAKVEALDGKRLEELARKVERRQELNAWLLR
jgi:hypothetical protein